MQKADKRVVRVSLDLERTRVSLGRCMAGLVPQSSWDAVSALSPAVHLFTLCSVGKILYLFSRQ